MSALRLPPLRLPSLPLATRARLWLSYQRYGLLLVAAPVGAVAAAWVLAPWWAAAVLAVGGLAPLGFGVEVLGRWPRKLRATRAALARIERGSFGPASVRPHCGDPCFRVVAAEILTRAGLPRRERRRLIRTYAAQLRAEGDVRVYIDHTRGTVTTYGGGAEEGT